MTPLLVLLFLFALVPLSSGNSDGEPCISEKVALEKVKHLEEKLGCEDAQREAIQSEENELISKAILPLMDIVMKDNRSSDAMNQLLNGRTQSFQGTSVGNLTIPKRSDPSSIERRAVHTVISAEFPFVWTGSGGDATSTATGNGDITILADETGWAGGGVGVPFRPAAGTQVVRFTVSSANNWRWHTRDCFLCTKSRTNGFFGILIQMFDLNQNHIRDFDFRNPLWNQGGADIGGTRFTEPLLLSLSSNNLFTIWVWFEAAASGHDATGEINAHVSSLTIDQFP